MNDEFNDHFMEHDDHKVETVHEETPQEREDREIEEATISRRHDTVRIILLSSIALMAVILVSWTWLHFYRPYSQSVEKGWIVNVANEGTLFKTIECKMLTEDLVLDTIKVKFSGDTMLVDGANFFMSLANDSLAREAVKWKASGKRVVVTYDEYGGALPWRGGTRRIVTDIRLDSIE